MNWWFVQTVLLQIGSELHADGLELFFLSRKRVSEDEEELENKFLLEIEIIYPTVKTL
jgi:hypothetical protein